MLPDSSAKQPYHFYTPNRHARTSSLAFGAVHPLHLLPSVGVNGLSLSLHFPDDEGCGVHLFTGLSAIWLASSVKCLFKSFAHFSVGLVCLLLIDF